MRLQTLFICLLAIACLMLPGCTAIEKFQAAYDSASADLEKMSTTLESLYVRAETIKAEYDKAVADKDANKAAALLEAAKGVFAEIGTVKAAYEDGRTLVENRRKELENAKSTQDYVSTVLGWIFGGITTVLGGSGITGLLVSRKRTREGLEGTTEALEKTKAGEARALAMLPKESRPTSAWAEAKAAMFGKLSVGALREIDLARP